MTDFNPGEVCDILKIPASTLRTNSRTYAEFLSEKTEYRRTYNDADIEILRLIREMNKAGKTQTTIKAALQKLREKGLDLFSQPAEAKATAKATIEQIEKQQSDQAGRPDQTEVKYHTNTLQSLYSRITDLEQQMTEVKAENDNLHKRLAILERVIASLPPAELLPKPEATILISKR